MKKRILSMLIALIMCTAMAVPAMAAVTYTEIEGPASVTLTDYLVVEKNAAVLNYTFNFTLTAGPAAVNVNAGLTTPSAPTVASITIGSGDKLGTVSEEVAEVLGEDKYDAGSNDVYCKTVTLNFSGVKFPKPGVYRYKLTQIEGSIPGVEYDAANERYIDIYVENGATVGSLKIAGTIVHTVSDADFTYNVGTDASMTAIAQNKTSAFVNTMDTVDLTLAKTVAGNQGDFTKEFEFTIVVELPTDDDLTVPGTLPLSVTTEDTSSATIVTQLTQDATNNNKYTATVKMKHTGEIAIKDLPTGTKVTITEANGDYVVSYKVGEEDGTLNEAQNGTTELTMDADKSVTFTNTLNGTIPTGVLLTIAPFVVLMLVGIAGAVIVLKRKRSR